MSPFAIESGSISLDAALRIADETDGICRECQAVSRGEEKPRDGLPWTETGFDDG